MNWYPLLPDFENGLVESKNLRFERLEPTLQYTKTKSWKILAVKGLIFLGRIAFKSQWRKFVFYPEPDTLYDAGCLQQITEMCNFATAHWRHGLKK